MGCAVPTYNVAPAYPLFYMWPSVLSLITTVYGILAFRAFLQRRNKVQEFLTSDSSGLSADRYFRLMCWSASEIVTGFPLTLYMLLSHALNTTVIPWTSWDDVHSDFDRFDRIPAIIIESSDYLRSYIAFYLWVFPYLCILFFIFFGIGDEQINQYKRWFYALLKPFGIKPPAPKPRSRNQRTWWQWLFRLSGSTTMQGSTLASSRGATDSLPAFRHAASQVSRSERPIPSARSKNTFASTNATLTFDFGDDDYEKVDSQQQQRQHVLDIGVNKPLPGSPTVVVESFLETDDEKYSRSSRISTGSPSVERPEVDIHAIETKVQRMV
jgi:hypothetical protein